MAGFADSCKDLWQFLAGTAVLRPKQLIADELKRNKPKLLQILSYYKPPTNPAGDKLKVERKLQGLQLEFVKKLSKFLGLDEVVAHDVYQSFLMKDYRGSKKELQTVLGSERHSQALLCKIRDFYYSERLYLLRCLNHILSFFTQEEHPYHEEYSAFVRPLLEQSEFIEKITSQYESICEKQAPTWETHGSIMNNKQISLWMIQNLREQCELLQLMILYYRNCEHPPASLAKLLASFKKQGFGRRQLNKHILDERMELFLQRIGFLQVIVIVEGLDIEDLQDKCQSNTVKEHHIIADPKFKELDALFCSLGGCIEHGPLLLTWSVIQQMSETDMNVSIRKLGNKALELSVFQYLSKSLQKEPFNGKEVIASICQNIVYGMVCCLLSVFHEDSLGDPEGLYELSGLLLENAFLSDEFWDRGLDEGIGTLLQSASTRFPLDFVPLLQLCVSLGKSNSTSAKSIVHMLQRLTMYTEYMDRYTEVNATADKMVWRLAKDRQPYSHTKVTIYRNALGQLHPQQGGNSIIQWQQEFNGWDVFVGEVHDLLNQVLQGAGTVNPDNIVKVTMICKLVHSVLSTDREYVIDTVPQITQLLQLMYQIIHRFSLMNPAPLGLLASCIEAIGSMECNYEVWHKLQQTGMFPYLTENIDSFEEAANGSGLNTGAYGRILAAHECSMGTYPLTIAFLKLLSKFVRPMHKSGNLSEMTASVMFVSREIFPVFHKWRYYHSNTRETIGHKTLGIFHNILNILKNGESDNKGHKINLRDVCVYNLLYTECGRALLDIIGTGVDSVESALASQGSAMEGVGFELIQLIRLAFSVLNRLLLLRPENAPPSPVEHSLSAQPANGAHRHIVAVIAQYIYHRHDSRLPTLATVLLKRLAMVFPMFILTCFGNEAEAIRDVYLSRLQATTEDIRLKVVILELLATCVDTQPGMIEMFLNVQTSDKKGDSKDVSLGKSSCLSNVLSLVEEKKQGTYQCPSELLSAALEFLHAIWNGRRETAISALRTKSGFWHSICLSLTRNLRQPTDKDVEMEVLKKETRTCANIMKILALELYNVQSADLDKNLKIVLTDLADKKRIDYWSEYLSENMKWASEEDCDLDSLLSDQTALYFLHAWRNLTIVLTTVKSEIFPITKASKAKVLDGILSGLLYQFQTPKMTALNVKLASISSALYLTILKHWLSDITDWNEILPKLEAILSLTCANSETLIPSVQIGLLGAITLIVQHVKSDQVKGVASKHFRSLVTVVANMIQQSTYQLPSPLKVKQAAEAAAKASGEEPMEGPTHIQSTDYDIKLKLQTMSVCLMEELITLLGDPCLWLSIIKEQTVVQCLIASIPQWIEHRQGIEYVHSVILLFASFARHRESAETLAISGLISNLCLVICAFYNGENPTHVQGQPPISKSGNGKKETTQTTLEWSEMLPLIMSVVSSMLHIMKYNFLEDALNFVGVHQDRMQHCLDHVGVVMTVPVLTEALETCRLIAHVSKYPREWRLHQLPVLHRLMTCVYIVTQRCVSLLVRPRLLQHILEKKNQEGAAGARDPMMLAPIARRLSQQSSTDDSDSSTAEVVQVQQKLLEIVAQCLLALKQFSPDLCEILLDQSMDISEFEPFLKIGFSTPSVEQDSEPTFGTMVSSINICLKLLTKVEPKSSPGKNTDPDPIPIKKSLILFVMENSLQLLMSQAVRYLKDPSLSARDKQLLKRELSAELNSFYQSLLRHYKRSPTSPAASPQAGSKKTMSESMLSVQEHSFFKLVDVFVRQVLR